MRNREPYRFSLGVLYRQIAALDASSDRLLNEWTAAHVRQGFAWRPGSVSFGTLLDAVEMDVEVMVEDRVELPANTTRAIQVPFVVGNGSEVGIAVVGEEHRVAIPTGTYSLTFQHGTHQGDKSMWCVFAFIPDDDPQVAVLIADPELSPPTPLLMEADPA